MSLDIWFEAPPCPTCKHSGERTTGHNITHNVEPMWRTAGAPLTGKDEGETGACLLPDLRAAIEAMLTEPERFRKMNSPNGWGTYEGCLRFLFRVAWEAADHPTWVMRASR